MSGRTLSYLPTPLCFRRMALVLGVLAALIALPPAPAVAQPDSLSGQFLVAEPSMPDPRFAETVILIVSHDSDGALGLIVNRRVGKIGIADLLAEFGEPSEETVGKIGLHYGGPVDPERGFILHSADSVPESSSPVGDDFAVTVRTDILTSIAEGTGPKDSLFTFGYAGWGPGQLESEMQRKDWFTAPADPDLVFTDEPAKTWQLVMDRKGVEL